MLRWRSTQNWSSIDYHTLHTKSFTHSRLQNYTKKVIYCGTQNNVLLPVYITTIIHIQNQNKVVEFLVAWLFTMPHVQKMFLSVMINHC
jgi:hypothetical protein